MVAAVCGHLFTCLMVLTISSLFTMDYFHTPLLQWVIPMILNLMTVLGAKQMFCYQEHLKYNPKLNTKVLNMLV